METPPLTLRIAAPRDLSRVDVLFARSYPKLLKSDYPPSALVLAVPRLARANPALLASGRYFVVETESGAILGAGGWSVTGKRTGEVRHLAVDPAFTRRGLARRILETVVAQAQGEGMAEMACLATRTGVPFYEAVGFRRLGPVTVSLGPGIGFQVVRMARTIGRAL